ncbi:ribbon-helix-helix protein, CopG family [Rhodopila sp.]|uniref:ribbon-helix-helix protein, CopG family n=1 Tax=Rhodopila sp. TaxID=2480087 RepID=UPI003D12F336
MRALIDIPDTQVRALAALCEKVNQPRAAIVRDAIAEYLAKYQRAPGEEAFGLWTANAPDGIDFQRNVRAEW